MRLAMSKGSFLKRLKGKDLIDALFKKGTQLKSKNLFLKILKSSDETSLSAGVSVPKKNFKRAVDRNQIKRQLRETFKQVEKNIPFKGACMLIYTGKKKPKTEELIKEMTALLTK